MTNFLLLFSYTVFAAISQVTLDEYLQTWQFCETDLENILTKKIKVHLVVL